MPRSLPLEYNWFCKYIFLLRLYRYSLEKCLQIKHWKYIIHGGTMSTITEVKNVFRNEKKLRLRGLLKSQIYDMAINLILSSVIFICLSSIDKVFVLDYVDCTYACPSKYVRSVHSGKYI